MAGRTSTHAITSFQKQIPARRPPKVSLECELVESEACLSRCVRDPESLVEKIEPQPSLILLLYRDNVK